MPTRIRSSPVTPSGRQTASGATGIEISNATANNNITFGNITGAPL